jgi:CheY-like chemotaxis protein
MVPRAKDNCISTARLAPTEHRASSQLSNQLVMCVDNEQEILDGMHGLLSKWGAQPLIATTMANALTQLESASTIPSLLLIDYHLSDGITGLDVIDALRRKAGVDLPAAILTANHTTEVADLVREAGHALLHKPVKPAALRALINRLLTRRVVH